MHTLSRIFNALAVGQVIRVVPEGSILQVMLGSQRKVKGKTGLRIVSVMIVYTDKPILIPRIASVDMLEDTTNASDFLFVRLLASNEKEEVQTFWRTVTAVGERLT
jgi:hypothetical protein